MSPTFIGLGDIKIPFNFDFPGDVWKSLEAPLVCRYHQKKSQESPQQQSKPYKIMMVCVCVWAGGLELSYYTTPFGGVYNCAPSPPTP